MSDERKPTDAEQAGAEILGIIIEGTNIEIADSVSTHEHEVRRELSTVFAHDQQAVVSIIQKCRDKKKFFPLGDNHHNALACPYCNGPLKDEIERLKEELDKFNVPISENEIDKIIAGVKSAEQFEENKIREKDSEIDQLKQQLAKHQWSGTAFGDYGSTARECPECGGLHPDDALNNGGGNYTHGKGHKPDCQLEQQLIEGGD